MAWVLSWVVIMGSYQGATMSHIEATATPECFLVLSGRVLKLCYGFFWELGELGRRGGVSGVAWELGSHLPIPYPNSSLVNGAESLPFFPAETV